MRRRSKRMGRESRKYGLNQDKNKEGWRNGNGDPRGTDVEFFRKSIGAKTIRERCSYRGERGIKGKGVI
jgi:hypothetical protein